MNPKLILNSFSDFDLSTYEAKGYLSLLEKNTLSAVEVAKLSGIPRGRVYEILDNLLMKGLCQSVHGKVKRYKASDPAILGERIETKIRKAEDEISRKTRGLDNLRRKSKETIKNLIPLYEKSRNNNSPLDYIEIIKNPFQVFKKFMQLCSEAKEEILVLTKPPKRVPSKEMQKEYDEAIAQEINIFKNGIKGRCIYELPLNEDMNKWQLEMIKRAVSAGEEARVIKEIPIFMAIFDSRVVMTTLEDPVSRQPSITTQVIEHCSLAKALKISFETLWERAEDYHVLESNQKGDDFKRQKPSNPKV